MGLQIYSIMLATEMQDLVNLIRKNWDVTDSPNQKLSMTISHRVS